MKIAFPLLRSSHLTAAWILVFGFLHTGCIKEVAPSDAITTNVLTNTTAGLTEAVNGAYALFKDHVTFNGDDLVCAQVTEDPFFLSFTLNHTPTQTNARYFWYISYKIINDANTVIEAVEKSTSADSARQQLLGECYFLRAFAHFNLARLFARPYSQNPAAPGIILRTSTSDPAAKARATVEDTYTQIIADAEKSANLMGLPRGNTYASKEAAWALLSRVYLYKKDYAKAVDYSNQVINSGKFALASAADYPNLFKNAPASSETIFCIAFTSLEDYGKFGSIASMVYSDGNSGWGEEFASSSIRNLMNQHPEDVRQSYILPLTDGNGNLVTKNGIETVGSSRVDLQACKLEYSIVSPK